MRSGSSGNTAGAVGCKRLSGNLSAIACLYHAVSLRALSGFQGRMLPRCPCSTTPCEGYGKRRAARRRERPKSGCMPSAHLRPWNLTRVCRRCARPLCVATCTTHACAARGAMCPRSDPPWLATAAITSSATGGGGAETGPDRQAARPRSPRVTRRARHDAPPAPPCEAPPALTRPLSSRKTAFLLDRG
jgi:hypothetical protein